MIVKIKPALSLVFLLSISNVFAQPCIDGFAGPYPCENIDQRGYLPLSDFNSENFNDIWGWTSPTTGREYVAAGLHNKTAFIDVTSPDYPLYLGYLPTASGPSLWRDVKMVGQYAFIVAEAEGHGMQVFDMERLEYLSAENTPVVFDADAYYPSFGNAHNIVADEENEFVYSVGSSTFGGGLHIIDVSDPLNPTYAGSDEVAGYCHDAQMLTYTGPDEDYQGMEIGIGFNEEQVVVYNLEDKTDVEIISTTPYQNVGYVHQGWFTEDQRYVISNDETDELDYGINTRTLVWDFSDLDNPQVLNYYIHDTPTIDHNLYIRDEMVYMSNYTSGLRILDLLDVAEGDLEYFGYFDVEFATDAALFIGTWSNYPYFESGIVPTTNMYRGLHILEPKFFELSQKQIAVCNSDEASMDVIINKRIEGEISFSIEMDDEEANISGDFEFTQAEGAPLTNQVSWSGLIGIPAGYYSGEIVINYNLGEERLPFVLIIEGGDQIEGPSLVSPTNDILPDQLVNFVIEDPLPGYGLLQVALDFEFENIVFEKGLFGEGTSFSFWMPYQQTTYHWRIVKPTACGEDVVSPSSLFHIDFVSSADEVSSREYLADIYPNPTTDQINIAGIDWNGITEISIIDLQGRVVKSLPVVAGNDVQRFDVADLPHGLYVLQTQVGSTLGKLVVN